MYPPYTTSKSSQKLSSFYNSSKHSSPLRSSSFYSNFYSNKDNFLSISHHNDPRLLHQSFVTETTNHSGAYRPSYLSGSQINNGCKNSAYIPTTVDPNRAHKLKNKNLNHPGYKKRPPHDVYEEDIECVYNKHGPGESKRGNIYVGNLQAAENPETLKRLHIGGLLTACKGIHIKHPEQEVPHYLYIPGDDHERYDLSVHFQTAISFIRKVLKETNILVHCMAGVSRSVTLVIVYLMQEEGLKMEEALRDVKRRRKIINPNSGFMQQMRSFERELFEKKNRGQKQTAFTESKMMRMAHNRSYDELLKERSFEENEIVNYQNSSKGGPLASYAIKQRQRPYFNQTSLKQTQQKSAVTTAAKSGSPGLKGLSYMEEREKLKRQLQNLRQISSSGGFGAQQLRSTIGYSGDNGNVSINQMSQSSSYGDFVDQNYCQNDRLNAQSRVRGHQNESGSSVYIPDYANKKRNRTQTHISYQQGSSHGENIEEKIANIKKKYDQYTQELRMNRNTEMGSRVQNMSRSMYREHYESSSPKINREMYGGSTKYSSSRQQIVALGGPLASSSPTSLNKMSRDELRKRMSVLQQSYKQRYGNTLKY